MIREVQSHTPSPLSHTIQLKESNSSTSKRASLSKKLSVNSLYKSINFLSKGRRNSINGFFEEMNNRGSRRKDRKNSLFINVDDKEMEDSPITTLLELPEPPKIEEPDVGNDFFIEVTKAANQKLEDGYVIPHEAKLPSPLCEVDPKMEKQLDAFGRADLQSPDPIITEFNNTNQLICIPTIYNTLIKGKPKIPKKSSKRKLRNKTYSLLEIKIPSGMFSPFDDKDNTNIKSNELIEKPIFDIKKRQSLHSNITDKDNIDNNNNNSLTCNSLDRNSILDFEFDNVSIHSFNNIAIQQNPDMKLLNTENIHNGVISDNSSEGSEFDHNINENKDKVGIKLTNNTNKDIKENDNKFNFRASFFEAELNKSILNAPTTPDLSYLPDRFKFQQNIETKTTIKYNLDFGTTPTSLIPPPIKTFSSFTKFFFL